MLLGNDEVTFLTLDPLRYEFAKPAGDTWDNNWLLISGHATTSTGEWTFDVPCLTTFEAKRISAWLRSAANRKVPVSESGEDGVAPSLVFVEPNIAFSVARYRGETTWVRVHFSLESRPSSREPDDGLHQFCIEIAATSADLESSAREWDKALLAFPER